MPTHSRIARIAALALAASAVGLSSAPAGFAPAERPFPFMNRAEIAGARALRLTDDHLFDAIHLRSDRERVYHWNHRPIGQPRDATR